MADGFHPLDLLDMPANSRSLLRLVMRHARMTDAEIRRAAHTMPEMRHLLVGLDAVLDDLVRRQYLVREIIGGEATFRANIQRRYLRARNPVFWDKLNLEALEGRERGVARLSDDFARRGGKRTLPQAIWDKLDAPDAPPAPSKKRSDLLNLF